MKLDKRLLTSGIYDAFEHYAGKEHGRESLEAFVQMVERATEERIIKLLDTSRQCTCSPDLQNRRKCGSVPNRRTKARHY
jgi:hypothetical protein